MSCAHDKDDKSIHLKLYFVMQKFFAFFFIHTVLANTYSFAVLKLTG